MAIKRVLAQQVAQILQEQQISKTEMARHMNTGRTQLDRFLDPDSDAVTLHTMQGAMRGWTVAEAGIEVTRIYTVLCSSH